MSLHLTFVLCLLLQVDVALITTGKAPFTQGLCLENVSKPISTTSKLLRPQAREKAEKERFEIGNAKNSFKANTKALAENEENDIAQVVLHFTCSGFKDHGDILGVYIFGMHAAVLINEASNAIAIGTRIQHPEMDFSRAKINLERCLKYLQDKTCFFFGSAIL
ncbi:hypothetical protein L1987_21350 [Smallanthus sonchifolius]|uniref:Uncharacterized protein n=1 Tax=Smallanthus sonchifolius TaxID=185202 RepID=A0ACB9IUN1_9ASTR|nr:hypothetical protein L1987_21350 [Smallanthus sonchifolius]